MNDAHIKFGIAGFYRMEAHRVDRGGRIVGTRLLADWFPNLVTDAGLDAMGTQDLAILTRGCHVGAGDTPPANGDTALESFVAGTGTGAGATELFSTSPYWRGFRRTLRFGAGAAAGNLSEVAMTRDDSMPTTMFSRALILDDQGQPTTITVLADEILDVTYELRIYSIQSEVAWNGTISGQAHSGVIRLDEVAADAPDVREEMAGPGWEGHLHFRAYTDASVLGAFGQPIDPATGFDRPTSISNHAYVGGSYQREFTANFGLDDGNFANGIHILRVPTSYARYKMDVDPPIMKDNEHTLALKFRVSWGRYTP